MNDTYGPQQVKDDPFTARMRFHQSWYRVHVLKAPCGTGPTKDAGRKFGNMLGRENAAKGMNFLTPQIFEVVKSRIAEKTGTVDEYRLLHNMLSSQPMCFNLFAPLKVDRGLAARVLSRILPVDIREVCQVRIEFTPNEPSKEYLGDRTAFDAFIEFETADGWPGFVGVETKLTEPFSPEKYEGRAYRRWMEREDSPWPRSSWDQVADVRVNQLWRDHLLAVAMLRRSGSAYSLGYFMLVRHPLDTQCAETAQVYQQLLKPGDRSFIDCPLNRLMGALVREARGDPMKAWLRAFEERYLRLEQSEAVR